MDSEIELLNYARDFKKNKDSTIEQFLYENNIFEKVDVYNIRHFLKKLMKIFDIDDINVIISFCSIQGQIPQEYNSVLIGS